MKRKLYLLHRRLSIIIAIPVLLWASSGLMHPFMTNIKPAVATQVYAPVEVPEGRMRVSLDSALRRRHIDSIAAVRLVHIDTNWFYQVVPVKGSVPLYLSCSNGNVLPMGDWLYAQWLARYFLEGSGGTAGAASGGDDCCGAATQCVLHPAKGAPVGNVSVLSTFDNEYKSINRLLPVYRVDFERADNIRVYVETTQDRFSFAMDKTRAGFDTFFRICHLWGWLDWMGRWRMIVEVGIAWTAFITAVLGIWIFFATRRTPAGGKRKTRGWRLAHRTTSVVAVLFTGMWSFSGGYHAFEKLTTPADPAVAPMHFAVESLSPEWPRLQAAVGKPVTNWSIGEVEGHNYWRVAAKGGELFYVRVGEYTLLPEGDKRYAVWLAERYFRAEGSDGLATGVRAEGARQLTAFDDEYNFSDKRLPVWRVATGGPGIERLYVETCSGELAARVDAAVYAEGYSFSVFHKHHFMDWGGKKVRDASTIVWAAMQILLVGVGLLFFFRFRK